MLISNDPEKLDSVSQRYIGSSQRLGNDVAEAFQ